MGLLPEVYCPTLLLRNNQRSMGIVRNEWVGRRTKQIEGRFCYIGNAVHDKPIEFDYRCTKEMIADIITKP